jgi:hypothetical protein
VTPHRMTHNLTWKAPGSRGLTHLAGCFNHHNQLSERMYGKVGGEKSSNRSVHRKASRAADLIDPMPPKGAPDAVLEKRPDENVFGVFINVCIPTATLVLVSWNVFD